tara:strand:+ start:3058 stop:3486 length:429 start_codon:yes stop_codon:yes gene_type:complete
MTEITKKRKLDNYLKNIDENDFCTICYEPIENLISYFSNCCKNLVCKECIYTWHSEHQKCIVCRTKNKYIRDYILNKSDKNVKLIENELQEQERHAMENEEYKMKIFIELENGTLTQCTYCGNIWDGNAQCNCYEWIDYDDI